jgi:hypothetical protein
MADKLRRSRIYVFVMVQARLQAQSVALKRLTIVSFIYGAVNLRAVTHTLQLHPQ